jgi:hypothetical protein
MRVHAVVRETSPALDRALLDQTRAVDATAVCASSLGAGIRQAFDQGAEWAWVMDSSVLPRADALQHLVEAVARIGGLPQPVALAGVVLCHDGRPDPLRAAWYRRSPTELSLEAVERRLLPIRAAGGPVLIHRRALGADVLPRPRLSQAGAVLEWTARLLRSRAGYLVPDSESRSIGDTRMEIATAAAVLFGGAFSGLDRVRTALELLDRTGLGIRRAAA